MVCSRIQGFIAVITTTTTNNINKIILTTCVCIKPVK